MLSYNRRASSLLSIKTALYKRAQKDNGKGKDVVELLWQRGQPFISPCHLTVHFYSILDLTGMLLLEVFFLLATSLHIRFLSMILAFLRDQISPSTQHHCIYSRRTRTKSAVYLFERYSGYFKEQLML